MIISDCAVTRRESSNNGGEAARPVERRRVGESALASLPRLGGLHHRSANAPFVKNLYGYLVNFSNNSQDILFGDADHSCLAPGITAKGQRQQADCVFWDQKTEFAISPPAGGSGDGRRVLLERGGYPFRASA